MSDNSKIGWTDATWNPVTGCTKVSPGCAYCYAEEFAERFRGVAGNYFEHGFDLQLRPAKLTEPLRWKRPRRVFVNSMSDLFHEDIPDEYIDKVFAVMALTPRHVYQVLTKRPERMREYLRDSSSSTRDPVEYMVEAAMEDIAGEHEWCAPALVWPLPNVWLGVTAENQYWADARIPLLLDTPAAVRFVSVEPMLGPVDLRDEWLGVRYGHCSGCRPLADLTRQTTHQLGTYEHPGGFDTRLSWCIVGAESGRNRRPFDPQWARDIAAQCQAAGVPVFAKQSGALRPGQPFGDPQLDALKQFPEVAQ